MEELLEALELAEEIISYCGGDAWERECTEAARTRFYEIHGKFFPQVEPEPTKYKTDRVPCEACGRDFESEWSYRQHCKGERHKRKVNNEQ